MKTPPLFALRHLPAWSLLVAVLVGSPVRAHVDFHIELGWRSSQAVGYNAAVILYEYDHYRGRELVLYPGESLHDFSDYEWGFRVRSVRVLGPVHVTLYDQSGHWGHEVRIHGDIPDLSHLKMRISSFSVISWGTRARSAYVSYNPSDVHVSVNWYHVVLPRTYWASPVRPRYAPPPPRFRPVMPRPAPDYRPPPRTVAPPPRSRPSAPPPAAQPGQPPAPPPKAAPPRTTPPPPRAAPPAAPHRRPPQAVPPPGQGTPQQAPPPRVTPPPNARGSVPPAPPRTAPGSRGTPPAAPPPARPRGG